MLRSVLVGLDGSKSGGAAGDFAIELAVRRRAHLVALGCTVPRDPALSATLDRKIEQVLREFGDRAKGRGIGEPELHQPDGWVWQAVQRAATPCDLVVLGRESLVQADSDRDSLPLLVERIVRGEPRPVILVPQRSAAKPPDCFNGPFLIAFDGSPASSRALHMFALLGFAEARTVHVLTVNEDSREAAGLTAARGCSLLERHGASKAHPLALGDAEAGTPAETILGLANALNAGVLVMGSYGHRGFREIFGSCTRSVLNRSPIPLFLYH